MNNKGYVKTNLLNGFRIEFHILQSFPVTCLNRDDVGSPKTAMIGGTQRARVSSQAWKRPVRMAMHHLGITHGTRTKLISPLIAEACMERGATHEQAKACGDKVEGVFIKEKTQGHFLNEKQIESIVKSFSDAKFDTENKKVKNKISSTIKNKNEAYSDIDEVLSIVEEECIKKGATKEQAEAFINKIMEEKQKNDEANEMEGVEDSNTEKTNTLLFLSPNEVSILADSFAEKGFAPDQVITKKDPKKQAKEIADLIGKVSETVDAVDIALFGRMVAQAAELNVEASASFAHAISTHKVANEVEFFTALDDRSTEPGAAHMGSLEFNSATYYRYVSLDLGQLARTLSSQSVPEAVEVFSKALFLAVPVARQSTQSGASPWGFAKVLVRRGQRLQVPFETAVKAENGGFLEPSIEALTKYLSRQEKLHGSLFGKIAEYTYGQEDSFSIDDLISALKRHSSEFILEGANA